MSKPPSPTSLSISVNICWMKTSLYIQIPLELRWVQIQGWLLCLAEIHAVAPQLPHSIPGPHLRLQLHQASPPACRVPERPCSAAVLSVLVSSGHLWSALSAPLAMAAFPARFLEWFSSGNKQNGVSSLGRGMSSRWAVRIPATCCHSPRLSLPHITCN